MKLAIFTDLHLGIKSDDPAWHQIAYDWADSFVGELKSRGIKDVVFLGDFFHNRNTISVITLDATNKFLQKFKDINLHMVLGNHDLYYKNEYTTSGVNLFDNFENIKVYSEPTYVDFGSKKTLMCGWGYDPMLYSADILFTHMEVNVFKHNSKSDACNEGYKCSDLLQKFNLVYTGHFHLRQWKKYTRGEVRYPGSPFQQNFSDERTERGFEIYDTETEETEFVENTISPKFLCYRLSELIKLRDFKSLSKKIENSFFKLVIDKNITDHDKNELLRLIATVGPRTLDHEWEGGRSFSQNVDDFEASGFDLVQNMRDYIDRLDAPDKDIITDMVLDYYSRATAS